jgi:hypothetical protein
MTTWNTTTADVAFIEHKQRTARADRLGWMIDEAAEPRVAKRTASVRWNLVTRVAGVVAALGGVLLAGPLR